MRPVSLFIILVMDPVHWILFLECCMHFKLYHWQSNELQVLNTHTSFVHQSGSQAKSIVILYWNFHCSLFLNRLPQNIRFSLASLGIKMKNWRRLLVFTPPAQGLAYIHIIPTCFLNSWIEIRKQQKHCFRAEWKFCSSVSTTKMTGRVNTFLQDVVAAHVGA